ncbi:cobyric acid synthase [Murimonas intestini]|uniref:Cobyric acid synthase n=1 Tax=Murimonas intestini TaxID=1337051 RepID=A0AB73SYR3_9FIRM|nr:cobyric acid synthase [Murimonas intestini]MCR1843033.1 cobyric acid synthase [Murimonas intestini]MCR1868034.1 cobyric acid synthase [Murimonas intestini]MCR1885502.1 cobyric acid synthase [Murimonas intestini]
MAKVIMVQGTMSNAGKSLLAAGLCRIFKQDGYSVAPFKSQNMALNSFITEEGLEMGRAQVMQAEAAGIKPSVYMNPILLKPTNDTGSQVIVNGEVLGNMSAREYFAYKRRLFPDVMRAFESLAEQYDIIVIEGAGSPAEINLKADDIVNMGMAKRAHAPVLLVGDIDRGGVFAQLYGTVELLDEDERAMIKGLIINKFRGDKTILDPGVSMLEEKTGIPVVGVAPYLNIEVEDEDSLTDRFSRNSEVGLIDIAVIRIPRISNFTDFNPFESISGVSLRYVHSVNELGNPDMIILPGTKNTMEDLLWMRQNGLEAAVLKAAAAGKVIFGVCGGYQMLGETLSDPHGVEAGGQIKGMGLLPMDTVFAEEKTRTRVKGKFAPLQGILEGLSGTWLEGYEIHMGESVRREDAGQMTEIANYAAQSDSTLKADGAYRNNVYGTYVHGVFDKEEVAVRIVEGLARAKGISMEDINAVDYQAFKESQYDILAAALREHLDMARIYAIMEEGV